MAQDHTPSPPIDDEPTSVTSRRLVLGGMGAGLIATPALSAVVAPASAQQQGLPPRASGPADQNALQNPVTEYPHPPFRKQQQPWPGLASKMTPRPDHGETSYKGSGRLAGRKALITGGDSGMGRAAAIAYAREGADVAISYYPTEEPDAREVVELIRGEGRKCIPIPGDLRQEKYCTELVAKAVQGLGGLDIVV